MKKQKREKRKRAIRERRCFVYRIFGHIAYYCRNKGKDKGPVQVPQNKFEVLKDRVMQRGEGSRKEVVKDRKEILKEERVKKMKIKIEKKEKKERKEKIKVQKKDLEKKEEKEKKREKIEKTEKVEKREDKMKEIIEREVEM